ncbi:hypothetical protein GW866_02820 [bacterium]|nr:hypothetical protein [bacterium]OIO87673.1 MAG: hypothetical protein AUK02_04815 [Anaerolineae bacterium CG2_30_58_95]PIZ25026.1 MAG: hypothetical protein COY47_08220 [Chloroflexi bacterium CG_4_10_14_0_8_um_filter_57_5]PJH75384.1 MAG: hypothetical protein CO064_06940 [Anaerolineae bacterium CG_4_9_14_0_8_um_filter_58_9]
MSRIRVSKKTESKTPARSKEWPAVVYFGLIGGLLLGYVIGRIALDVYPHPYHWASGLVGAVIGFVVGWIWYWRRGDVV